MHKASLVYIVDLHGFGNFSHIQSDIDALPESSHLKTLIIIN